MNLFSRIRFARSVAAVETPEPPSREERLAQEVVLLKKRNLALESLILQREIEVVNEAMPKWAGVADIEGWAGRRYLLPARSIILIDENGIAHCIYVFLENWTFTQPQRLSLSLTPPIPAQGAQRLKSWLEEPRESPTVGGSNHG